MSAVPLAARERVRRPREQLIASRLKRFAWRHREAVTTLAQSHERLADLALSFPALLFALAVPRRRFDPVSAIEKVIAGAPLREVALGVGAPSWSRRLMPEAFLGPLPVLPSSETFVRQALNYLPASPKAVQGWLAHVGEAARLCDDEFAISAARWASRGDQSLLTKDMRRLALFAWYSRHGEGPAADFLLKRWTPEMSLSEASAAANAWLVHVFCHLYFLGEETRDMWARPGIVDGYAFEPVSTAADLVQGAQTLCNCAATYGFNIALDQSRIWTVRHDGRLIAMLELERGRSWPTPVPRQLSGEFNGPVSDEIWSAAREWWRTHGDRETARERKDWAPDLNRWIEIWKPYWRAKRTIPAWLPIKPQIGPHRLR